MFIQPHFEADETISGVITIAHEVTAQVLARKKIEESEHRYQQMIYSSPSLIAILKGENHIISIANDAIVEIWGKGKDVIGKPFLQALPELVEQGVTEELQNVYTTGIPSRADERPVHFLRNGKVEFKYYSYVFQPQRNATGVIEGVAIIGAEVTSQALLNKTIKESEQRFRNLVEKATSPICILKGEEMILEVANEPVFKVWKVGKEAIGKPFLEIIPEMKGQPFMGWLLDVFHTGVTHYGNEEPSYFIRKNGEKETIYFNFVYQPYHEDDGSISGVMVLATDVTEQVVARKKIERSEAQFRSLVIQAPVAMAVFKGKEYIVEVANEHYLEIVGQQQDFIGRPLFNALPELETQGVKQLMDSVMQSGIPNHGNEWEAYMIRNGKSRQGFYNFVFQPVKVDDESVTGIIVVANEVTEQVLARKKVEAQNQLFSDMLMTAPGFVATMSGPDHVYELVNEQYQSLFGTRQIKGKPILVALPELEGQGFDKLLDNVYTTGKPYVGIDIPITLARDENLAPELRYFNFSYQPMYNETKKIFSILVFGYEVTEQVLAKNKNLLDRELYSTMLEERVKDRTFELLTANNELLKKNDELQKMNAELESFTYISSHDLQEPLRKIQTFSSRLLEKEYAVLSDKGKEDFLRLQKTANRMQTLIEDLLAYSQTNLTDRKFETTDLTMLTEQVKADLAENILEKSATINTNDLGEATINRFQFRQVMHNLISNALKFSKAGVPPYIIIQSKIATGLQFQNDNPGLNRLAAESQYTRISFFDNGIGFKPEYKDKIFELFQRLHAKEAYAGTGIGLSIVKKIVDNHGGVIIASGEINQGARFDIYIPVNENKD